MPCAGARRQAGIFHRTRSTEQAGANATLSLVFAWVRVLTCGMKRMLPPLLAMCAVLMLEPAALGQKTAEDYSASGQEKMANGDMDGGIADLGKAIALDPEDK